jgi:hypothetical protein
MKSIKKINKTFLIVAVLIYFLLKKLGVIGKDSNYVSDKERSDGFFVKPIVDNDSSNTENPLLSNEYFERVNDSSKKDYAKDSPYTLPKTPVKSKSIEIKKDSMNNVDSPEFRPLIEVNNPFFKYSDELINHDYSNRKFNIK